MRPSAQCLLKGRSAVQQRTAVLVPPGLRRQAADKPASQRIFARFRTIGGGLLAVQAGGIPRWCQSSALPGDSSQDKVDASSSS